MVSSTRADRLAVEETGYARVNIGAWQANPACLVLRYRLWGGFPDFHSEMGSKSCYRDGSCTSRTSRIIAKGCGNLPWLLVDIDSFS